MPRPAGSYPIERRRYSLNTFEMAAVAEALMRTSSDQPKRNPASRPHPSRR